MKKKPSNSKPKIARTTEAPRGVVVHRPCSPSYYTFRNRDGQTIQLRGDLTMEDLVKMGYRNIGLVLPETPLQPCEWRADLISENVKTVATEGAGESPTEAAQPSSQD